VCAKFSSFCVFLICFDVCASVVHVSPHVCLHMFCMHSCMEDMPAIHTCMYVCTYACMCVCMYVRMYICMYVCMYVHVYVCITHLRIDMCSYTPMHLVGTNHHDCLACLFTVLRVCYITISLIMAAPVVYVRTCMYARMYVCGYVS
jgi:hypothetical protein